MYLQSLTLAAVAAFSFSALTAYAQISPVDLRTEHRSENVLVGVPASPADNPRFSWTNLAAKGAAGESQKARRICVASSEDALLKGKPDMWDSKKIKSHDSYLIPYEGNKLAEATTYYWRVKVWNARGKASAWSEPSKFTTGLLPSSWKAQWIGAPWEGEGPQYVLREGKTVRTRPAVPYLRKSFDVRGGVKDAKAFVSGLGYFEFFLNGKKVGDDLLVPNFTNYTSRPDLKYGGISIDEKSSGFRVQYLAYDVTSILRQGRNAAGAMISGGYFDNRSRRIGAFGSQRFICQIMITYNDGSRQTIVSDPSWKAKESAIVSCELYEGENYDARKEITDWCGALYDDSAWENAAPRKAPDGKLTAFDSNPDKVTETFKPISFKHNADGSYTIDFGQVISGHVHIKGLSGERDKVMKIRYESEYPQEVSYTFKDSAPIDYKPQFTWYVFREVTISGAAPKAGEITAEAVNTDMRENSEFSCSNELFNTIHKIWIRTEKDNIHSGVESDCPHRERLPYTGDGQGVCTTVMHNFDGTAFYRSWLSTMRDSQDKDTGYEPNSAPWCIAAGGGVAWGAAMTLIPWEYYLHYGDKKVLEENYDAAKRQVDYMTTWITPQGIMNQKRLNALGGDESPWLRLGDWVPSYQLPANEKVHTYMLWRCADRMSRMAKAMGNAADEKRYRGLADKTAEAYDKAFYENGETGYGDYGCNIFASDMGLAQKRPNLKNILAREIGIKYKRHLNVGFVALGLFFENLAKLGLNDLAYSAMNQTDYPSFGRWIKQDATVFWEQFDGNNSRNHPFLGNALTYFYRTLAGVYADESHPGFKHFIVRPTLADSLEHVSYSQISPYGKISSDVSHNAEKVRIIVGVPVGSGATVYVPAKGFRLLTINGKPANKAKHVKSAVKTAEGFTVELPQGRYELTATK